MNLNKKSKSLITIIVAFFVVELWRNFPWLKKAFLESDSIKKTFFDEDK